MKDGGTLVEKDESKEDRGVLEDPKKRQGALESFTKERELLILGTCSWTFPNLDSSKFREDGRLGLCLRS